MKELFTQLTVFSNAFTQLTIPFTELCVKNFIIRFRICDKTYETKFTDNVGVVELEDVPLWQKRVTYLVFQDIPDDFVVIAYGELAIRHQQDALSEKTDPATPTKILSPDRQQSFTFSDNKVVRETKEETQEFTLLTEEEIEGLQQSGGGGDCNCVQHAFMCMGSGSQTTIVAGLGGVNTPYPTSTTQLVTTGRGISFVRTSLSAKTIRYFFVRNHDGYIFAVVRSGNDYFAIDELGNTVSVGSGGSADTFAQAKTKLEAARGSALPVFVASASWESVDFQIPSNSEYGIFLVVELTVSQTGTGSAYCTLV